MTDPKTTFETLEQATSEKDELLGTLRERARKKIHLLAQLGYRPDSEQAASEFLMEHVGADSMLMERWQSAQQRLSECQREWPYPGSPATPPVARIGHYPWR